MAYRHIVLFRIRDGVADADIEGAQAALRALGSFPEIIQWRIERSLDERKGTVLIEDGTFADLAGFQLFHARPEHRAAGDRLSAIADWWIGDYVE